MSENHQTSPGDLFQVTQQYQTYEAAISDIQKELIKTRNYQNLQYQLLTVSFNLLVIVQVIIGATITALGPSGGDHMLAITILGALNTSIAGILSLLKGRGLPQRLRRNMAEISKVLDLIRERKTLLRYGNLQVSNLATSELLQDVFQAYNSMKQIIENNQPDTYADGNASRHAANSDQQHREAFSKANGKQRQRDEEMGSHS
jgi:SMODS and SLOG-associating 2TM effector domain